MSRDLGITPEHAMQWEGCCTDILAAGSLCNPKSMYRMLGAHHSRAAAHAQA